MCTAISSLELSFVFFVGGGGVVGVGKFTVKELLRFHGQQNKISPCPPKLKSC